MKSEKLGIKLGEMLKKYKGRLIFQAILFGVLMIMVMVWEPFLLKIFFYVIETRQRKMFFMLFLIISAVLLILFTIGYFNNTYLDMDRWNIMNQECKEALLQLPRLSYDDLKRNFTEGGIFERIFSLGQAKLGIFFNTVKITISILSILFLFCNLMPAGVFLLILSTLMLSIQLVIIKLRSCKMVKFEKKIRIAEEDTNTYAQHLFNDLPFIIMNQLEEAETVEYLKIRSKVFQLRAVQTIWEAIFQNIEIYVVIIMKLILAIWMLPLMLGSGIITAIFTTVDKMKIIFSSIAENYIEIKQEIVVTERYNELLQYQTKHPEDTGEAKKIVDISNAKIEVNEKLLFDSVSLEIKEGEKIAIIGHNGCGKSSVLKVIAGLYQVTSGKILRKKGCSIAYIPANVNLFEGSGVENIKMSSDCDNEINFWFCNSFMKQQIMKMAGGEQQRINIGRGLYKEADLILADEPTSNLDPEASYHVMAEIIKKSKTCVIITHDKNVLELFTRVIDLGGQSKYEKTFAN